MNTATGQSAKKEHWKKGPTTECNRKISSSCNSTDEFKYLVENHPEMCCNKCLTKFKEKYKL